MNRTLATLTLSFSGLVFLAGCPGDGGHDHDRHRHDYDRRADHRDHRDTVDRHVDRGGGGNWDRRDHDHDREAQGWEMIGRRAADDKRDRDEFDVGRGEGRFDRIKVQVRGGELVMNKMVIHFRDGTKFEPPLQHHFSNRETSRTIDLPRNNRAIEKVVLLYRGVRGKPELYVYAK
jgi:hypothetical protein